MPEEKNTKFCSACGAEINIEAKICPKCGVEQPIIPKKISAWWYIFAFFFGIVGGIIAWTVNKDLNPKKAIRLIVVGFALPVIGILASIILVSLASSGAREKVKDAKVVADISQMRSVAEVIYSNEGNYNKIKCTHPQMTLLCQDIKTQVGEEPTVYSAQKNYCAYIRLLSEDYRYYYCIDSSLRASKTSIYPGVTGHCDGKTFICP